MAIKLPWKKACASKRKTIKFLREGFKCVELLLEAECNYAKDLELILSIATKDFNPEQRAELIAEYWAKKNGK